MKKQSRITLFLLLVLNLSAFNPTSALAEQSTTDKPRFVSGVDSITTTHDYIQHHPAPIYWKLSPYYLPQRNDTSCSLATSTMIVNAARSSQDLKANTELATQNKLLEKVNDNDWSAGVSDQGDGITLDQLSTYLPKALEAYGLKKFSIETVHVNDTTKATEAKLLKDLIEMERTGNTFIIGNFDQKYFSGTLQAGHFSPLGAYDTKNKRVLVMDVDRAWFEPYWVPEKLFLESMATSDANANKNRGYIVVKFLTEKDH